MDKNIYFDHAYTADRKHRFMHSLEDMGFTLSEREVEHPGKAFCRFIYFKGIKSYPISYLEFIDARSKKVPILIPGISFGYRSDLERYYEGLGGLDAEFLHQNYEWKRDSKSRLPGWNFVKFKNTGIKGFYPWMTEYEPFEGRPNRKVVKHSNGAKEIVGVEFEVSPRGMTFFQKLLNKRKVDGISLRNGVTLHVSEGKCNKLRSVLISCKDLRKFHNCARGASSITFKGHEAVKISNPSGMWNLIIADSFK